MKKVNLLGIGISVGRYDSFLEQLFQLAAIKESCFICVSNVHMLVEAYLDANFSKIVNSAKICTPDGMPLVWGLKLLYGIHQDRVAGMDILPDILRTAEQKSIPIFFYGGSPEMLAKTSSFVDEKYPSLKIGGMHSPPFRPLTEQEELNDIELINASGAKILFVVLGCPKQEKWMAKMNGKIHMPMIGIGGALPVMVGLQSRAPEWIQNAGLEWLFRLMQEPRRLFKRYAVTNSLFSFLLIKAYIKGLFKRNDYSTS
ncbi:WecB/TagA/CpsF family glycosyltransferase [Dyadobacter chenwenxiniae]|uniref:WecB/TagA/CpsF family glycosyltransferase n=1 Tax=Dyadobacter chenwenxiniae TaxID=2906456 RepID=A0A9X1TFK5_9BACT|nr:WecB/TagA/CpsF family glycosyltransferase [Dyadobacter chenwenxiniae]MCF0062724.1 WecB/TagA/CpsF family glycosyltransferase [Dyadobacter chenwenxiniae]UON83531.1 WecB/TagA/CpsF family glycosyltransferase [Dyadobacter chenwenxiniae]